MNRPLPLALPVEITGNPSPDTELAAHLERIDLAIRVLAQAARRNGLLTTRDLIRLGSYIPRITP